jgi:hypothetical protein
MMGREEIIEWLESLPPGCNVGVDDGGLQLHCDVLPGVYCEIGGMPIETQDEDPEALENL